MSPDDKGPHWRRPFGLPPPNRDRDVRVEKHAAPEFVQEECTGRYSGPELDAARARRPTPERVAILERKHDALADVVTETRLDVKGVVSKVDTLLDLASKAEAERARRSELDALERERRARRVIPIIKAVGAALALIIAALVGRGAL